MASRYDVTAMDGLLSAQGAAGKPMRGSSLREYRDAGVFSRDTVNQIKSVQSDVGAYNADLKKAQAYIPEYKSAAANYNAEADSVDAGLARYNAQPKNTGLLKAMGDYQGRLNTKNDATKAVIDKVNGLGLSDRSSAIAKKSEEATAAKKQDMKRYTPQQNNPVSEQNTDSSDNSVLAENNVFSSLAQYRSAKG